MSLRLPLLVALATAACTGGGGALSAPLETQDKAPLSNEGVSSSTERSGTRERPESSLEPAPRSTETSPAGGGAFDCGGTYDCTLNGQKSDDPVVLVPSADGCRDATKNDGTILRSDGSIVQKGQVVASATLTGNSFSYSTSITSKDKTTTFSIVCTKVSSDTTATPKKDDDDIPPVTRDGG